MHYYEKLIERFLLPGSPVTPRHVEAWMRLKWRTLDHLPTDVFRREATILCLDVKSGDMSMETLNDLLAEDLRV